MDVGIDLGTTFSVIVVRGKPKLVDGYAEPEYVEQSDVTIIPTFDGDKLVPSVFWADSNNPGNTLVGIEAKQMAQEGQAPIMFSKRWIGTSEPLKMGSLTFTAKAVATEVLKYLKHCAERALGVSVRRAVITHPAYFSRNQVDETCEAAIAAGFDMSEPDKQMLMEPTAAALSFLQSDTRDPLTVLTYDLGGGTFDVTVLERRQGVIKLISFDGDHLLGGYNFDRALMSWVLRRAAAAGRTVSYDDQNPEDQARRSRLLQFCESIKIKLSEQKTSKMFVQVSVRDILVDNKGKPIQFAEKINREQFVEEIKSDLEKTIACSLWALAKGKKMPADLAEALLAHAPGPDNSTDPAEAVRIFRQYRQDHPGENPCELDKIVLVGGSVYGPWVEEAVRKDFPDVEIEMHEPDKCVAVGAALQTAQLGELKGSGGLELTLNVQPVSVLQQANVAGTLRATGGAALGEEVRAALKLYLATSLNNKLGPVALGADGGFIFDDVSLMEEQCNEFVLSVRDNFGAEPLSHAFTITHRMDASGDTSIPLSLPKSIYAGAVKGGPRLIAEEGKELPVKCEEIRLVMLHSEADVEIPILQDDAEVGRVKISGIPAKEGEKHEIVIQVEITRKNKLVGKAEVLNPAGTVVAECAVDIAFPSIALKSLNDLRAEYDRLESERLQACEHAQDPVRRMQLNVKGKKDAGAIQGKFEEQEPDKQELTRMIRDFEKLVKPPKESDLVPPHREFAAVVDHCNVMIKESKDPQVTAYESQVKGLSTDGEEAYKKGNQRKWAQINDALRGMESRIQKLTKKVSPGDDPPPPPPPQELPETPELKEHFLAEIEQLKSSLGARQKELKPHPEYPVYRGRIETIGKDIAVMEMAVKNVKDSTPNKQALAQIQSAMRGKPLIEKRINNITVILEEK